MDYGTLGLKVGIEIHQQLSTGKLFCSCPSELVDDHHREIVRRLRPTQSELGEIDKAALEEAERKLQFRYQTVPCSCLVEADEEPPHDANKLAIEASLEMASLLHMTAVDEIHFMRKIVIDGSTTGGFQRTALVATKGYLELNGKRFGVATVCLEEDAARKLTEHATEVTYRLDRLGIPLVEMATDPDMSTPEEARAVAARLGALLRATKKVRRGIGTIREDINISVSGGARVEIKGAQDLRLVPVYIEEEVKRQLALLEVKDSPQEERGEEGPHGHQGPHAAPEGHILPGAQVRGRRRRQDTRGQATEVRGHPREDRGRREAPGGRDGRARARGRGERPVPLGRTSRLRRHEGRGRGHRHGARCRS